MESNHLSMRITRFTVPRLPVEQYSHDCGEQRNWTFAAFIRIILAGWHSKPTSDYSPIFAEGKGLEPLSLLHDHCFQDRCNTNSANLPFCSLGEIRTHIHKILSFAAFPISLRSHVPHEGFEPSKAQFLRLVAVPNLHKPAGHKIKNPGITGA